MSTIKINALQGKFFLSGSISLSPLQSVEKDIDSMTNTEIQDTIEGHDIKTLNVEGITALREEYKKRTNKQIINNVIVDNSELESRVDHLEKSFDDLASGVVESKMLWSTTEW